LWGDVCVGQESPSPGSIVRSALPFLEATSAWHPQAVWGGSSDPLGKG
ncbi:hypothetical protein E2320_007268, partial [Naja naja]